MPDILIGPLIAAEANTGAQQALPSPQVTGYHLQLTHLHGFSAVHLHPHCLLHVSLQKLLQQVILLILKEYRVKISLLCCSYTMRH